MAISNSAAGSPLAAAARKPPPKACGSFSAPLPAGAGAADGAVAVCEGAGPGGGVDCTGAERAGAGTVPVISGLGRMLGVARVISPARPPVMNGATGWVGKSDDCRPGGCSTGVLGTSTAAAGGSGWGADVDILLGGGLSGSSAPPSQLRTMLSE